MHKLQRKFILIGILSILVVALVVVFAVPSIAAGFPWGPRGGANKNMTVVQGTLAAGGLTNNAITITETGSTSLTLGLNESTNFTIHGNDWIANPSLLTGNVTAVYDKTVTPPVASQVMINMPTPTPGKGNPPENKNFASLQGTLKVNSLTSITITPNTQPSITFNATDGQTVTVLYNTNSNNVIQGLMLNRSGQPTGTPKNPPNKNFSTVQGTLTVSTSTPQIITITLPADFNVKLTEPSNPVTILYNSSTGTIQGLMLPMSGQGFGPPKNMPNQNRPNQNGPNQHGNNMPPGGPRGGPPRGGPGSGI